MFWGRNRGSWRVEKAFRSNFKNSYEKAGIKGDLNNSIFTEPINEPEKSNMNDRVSETYPTVSSLSTQPVRNKKTPERHQSIDFRKE